MIRIFVIAAAIALGGCTQLAGKIEMDSAAAAAQAAASGHPERAACYMAIGSLAVGQKGLLTKFETVVEGREIAEGPCASIVAGVALHLIDKLPVTP